MSAAQFYESAFTHIIGRMLSHYVALKLNLGTNILPQQRHDLFVQGPRFYDFNGRNLKPHLKDLGNPERHAARGKSPHINVVGLICYQGHDLAVNEYGADHGDVI